MKKRRPDAAAAVILLLFGCTALLLGGLVFEERAELRPPAEFVYWEADSSGEEASGWPESAIFFADSTASAEEAPEPSGEPGPAPSGAGPEQEKYALPPSSDQPAEPPLVSERIKIYLDEPGAPEEDVLSGEDIPEEPDSGEERPEESSRETFDPNGTVNLNTAGLEELKSLKGIGDVLAQRIIDYRTQNGGFGSIEEIMEVKGIAEGRFAAIRDRITV